VDHNRLCERGLISRRRSNVIISIVVISPGIAEVHKLPNTAEDVNEAVTYQRMSASGSHQ